MRVIDGQADKQNYDSQDHDSIAASRGKNGVRYEGSVRNTVKNYSIFH